MPLTSHVLKNADQLFKSTKNIYTARITTDVDNKTIIKTLNEHKNGVNQEKVESQTVRIKFRNASDITEKPSNIIPRYNIQIQKAIKEVVTHTTSLRKVFISICANTFTQIRRCLRGKHVQYFKCIPFNISKMNEIY